VLAAPYQERWHSSLPSIDSASRLRVRVWAIGAIVLAQEAVHSKIYPQIIHWVENSGMSVEKSEWVHSGFVHLVLHAFDRTRNEEHRAGEKRNAQD
jgi:hypothetical protein